MHGEEVLVPLFLMVFAAAVTIVALSTRHKERMAMVEKGLSSEDIKAMYARQSKRDPLSSLKWGLLLVLAGIAILLTNYLHTQYGMEEGAGIGIVMLFVGIGLVVFYTIAGKKNPQ